MSKPKIRFKGYEEDWEQRKLGDVTELKSASRVHKGEWTDSGVPFFRSSDVMAAINGTTNEKAYISEELYEKLSNASGKLEEGDVLVTGGGSVGNPYIVPNSEPLYTKDADLLWIKNQGRFYPYFLYEYFFSPTFRIYLSSISHVGTIAHYTITQLSETPISLPDIEEQIKVGEYFESLDRLITLHQRKCEETKKLKKYMLQKMFPQNGKRVPEIRFAGFTEDWEQRKLSDITLKIGSGKTPSGGKNAYVDDGIPLIRSQNINNDRVDLEDIVFIDEETDNSMENSRVFTDDVLLNITGASIGRSAVYRGKDKANVNQHVCIIRPTKDFDSDFIQLNLASNFGQKQIDASQAGGGREGLNFQEIGKMSFMFPSNQEQMKIGVYFNHIDYLITLHQRQYQKLFQ